MSKLITRFSCFTINFIKKHTELFWFKVLGNSKKDLFWERLLKIKENFKSMKIRYILFQMHNVFENSKLFLIILLDVWIIFSSIFIENFCFQTVNLPVNQFSVRYLVSTMVFFKMYMREYMYLKVVLQYSVGNKFLANIFNIIWLIF